MKYFKALLPFLLTSLLAGCRQKNEQLHQSTKVETIVVAEEKIMESIVRNLITLQEKLDTALYSAKLSRFVSFYSNVNPDKEYLENYLDTLNVELESLKFPFDKLKKKYSPQIESVLNRLSHKPEQEIHDDILFLEYEYLNDLIWEFLESRIVVDQLSTRIISRTTMLKLGDEYDADLLLSVAKTYGKQWFVKATTIYLPDSIPVHSDSLTMTGSTDYLDYSFKPSKRGDYLVKGKWTFFHEHSYIELPFEQEFSVE